MNIARTNGDCPTGRSATVQVARATTTFLRRAALGIWVTLLASVTAPAAEFETHLADDLNIVVVTGEILPGDDDLFLAEVERATADGRHALVALSSDGGALGAGMHMGLVIAEAGLPTFVPEGERCASACALAWLAGEPRMTTRASEIGFHQPYDESSGAMVASIEANAVVGHYIATIGMGPEIVSFAVSAPPEGMAWLTVPVAHGLGLDVVEIASEGTGEGNEAMAMLTSRTPPVDESERAAPGTPLPVMRPLTPVEVASVSLTGTVDGTGEVGGAGSGLPIVTAYTPEAGADGVGGPFEPLLSGGEVTLLDPDHDDPDHVDPFDHGLGHELDHEDEMTGGALPSILPSILPASIGTPADGTDIAGTDIVSTDMDGTDMLNVETAVLDALRAYGAGGPDALHETSAACWRAMRGEPTVRSLQYCHVFDLVAAEVVDPADPGEFAAFAIGVRLRAHRELVPADMPAGYAAAWRGEAGMVVAAMDAH